MKERMQKTLAEVKGCPQKDRTESDNRIEVMLLIGIAENNLPHIAR